MSKNIIKAVVSKIFILLILILNPVISNAQVNCEIQITDGYNLPICQNEEISLMVEYNQNYTYKWYRDGVFEGNTDPSITFVVTENGHIYKIEVIDSQNNVVCSDEITITMMNTFDIQFEQTQLTCSNNNAENGQNAKVIATASGEGFVSFTYEWGCDTEPNVWTNPGNPQEAIGLKAWKEYYVDVTGVANNGNECTQRATFIPKSYPNPKLEIISEPKDTAYLQNPYVKFSFEGDIDSIEYNSWSWSFFNNPENPNEVSGTSILQEPTNVYYQESKEGSPYKVELNVKSIDYGCDTTFSTDIIVLPVKLKIPNIFTPNGDGVNDFFIIDNDPTADSNQEETTTRRGGTEYESYNPLNDYYIRTELTIFNRWGRIVYKSSNYKNDWDGGKLPDGTYFYVLECVGEYNNHRYQGSVTIFGSGR